jgi:hypothetical protein
MENNNTNINEEIKNSKTKEKLEEMENKLRKILKNASFLEVKFIKNAIKDGKIQLEDILDMVNTERKVKMRQ